jgi:hypothetical protein
MDRLPPEILTRIFEPVCTDGGKTVNALRVQSRSICAAANLHRFRVVAVAGIDALGRLVDELAQTPPELRRIEHLFISDVRRSHADTRPGQAFALAHGDRRGETRSLGELLSELVIPVGPHLRTLTILLYGSLHLNVLPHVLSHASLPILTTLSLRISSTYSSKRPQGTLGDLQLPSLRLLTLDFPIHALIAYRYVLDFVDRTPALQRLAFHSTSSMNGSIGFYGEIRTSWAMQGTPPWSIDFHPCLTDYSGPLETFQRTLDTGVGGVEGMKVHARREHMSYSEWRAQWQQAVDEHTCPTSRPDIISDVDI